MKKINYLIIGISFFCLGTTSNVNEIDGKVQRVVELYQTEDETPREARQLMYELEKYGTEAVPVFEAYYDSKDPFERVVALQWLDAYLNEEGLDYLYQSLEDPDADVRMSALHLLLKYKDVTWQDRVMRMLEGEPDKDIKIFGLG